jgi:hypothetical protein
MMQVFMCSLFASISVHSRLNCIDPAKVYQGRGAAKDAG